MLNPPWSYSIVGKELEEEGREKIDGWAFQFVWLHGRREIQMLWRQKLLCTEYQNEMPWPLSFLVQVEYGGEVATLVDFIGKL